MLSGANKGIGFGTARQLGQQGWSILLGTRSEERGLAAVAELKASDVNAEWVKVDLNDVSILYQIFLIRFSCNILKK